MRGVNEGAVAAVHMKEAGMRIVSSRLTAVVGLALALLWAGEASAQSTIAGLVKDTTGAVMPGVTVEASSPVLIEKTRTAVTDGNGSVPDHRPAARRLHGDVHACRVSARSGAKASSSRRTSPPRSTPKCGSARSKRRVTVSGAVAGRRRARARRSSRC